MPDIPTFVIIPLCAMVIAIALACASTLFFTVNTQTASIVERFGKFARVAEAGLNFKLPWEAVHSVNLRTLQITGSIETKTLDNVFVTLPYSVQYRVIDRVGAIVDAYYKPTNVVAQIQAVLDNILLGHIPESTLDDIFLKQPAIAQRATAELSAQMLPFGHEIVQVLITDIIPPKGVRSAMNRINSETRNAEANKAQGNAEYVLKVRQAEADAEVKRLEGVGIAKEREAIAVGWEESIKKLLAGTSMTDREAAALLLFTNWTDMLRAVGGSQNSTLVLLPSGPDGMQSFQQTLTALLAAQAKEDSLPSFTQKAKGRQGGVA